MGLENNTREIEVQNQEHHVLLMGIQEYTVKKDENGNGAIITDGKIYRVSPDEPETAVAELDKKDKCFALV